MSFHQLGVAAFFQDNSALLDLVNSQVLAKPLICLGDGHDGIWNLFREIGEKQERIEILDWYHLTHIPHPQLSHNTKFLNP
ncbi:hypothetical protein myaer102_43180 [Microcystis viridis NIES-102]|uniref:Transposase n=1 Tax=Microcystis viridis NIES-102 TaxID=213615 RepID=A0A3G9K0H4_MICVR|nr:hypothetical protein myaer102_43180 [Microcystis viridis NIES-102]